MLCLMRKRRIGSDVCLGGYHVSAQEVLDQGTVIRGTSNNCSQIPISNIFV
jgi:hypothetical protein